MALQKTHTLDSGLVGTNAYHRITEVRAGERRQVSVSTSIHTTKEKRMANAQTIGGMSYRFNFDASELIQDSLSAPLTIYAWAYAKLKTLDEFAGAVDV